MLKAADDRVDDLQQLLWIEPVRERGEAGDVREERGDQPSLLGQLAAGFDEPIGDRPGTKLRSVSVSGCATPAGVMAGSTDG